MPEWEAQCHVKKLGWLDDMDDMRGRMTGDGRDYEPGPSRCRSGGSLITPRTRTFRCASQYHA